jgi:hypothetical protein
MLSITVLLLCGILIKREVKNCLEDDYAINLEKQYLGALVHKYSTFKWPFCDLLDHKVGRVIIFFTSRRNWDSPNPSPVGECAPPPVLGGGAHLLEREGLGEPQFRRGDIHSGTLYIQYMYFVCGTVPIRETEREKGNVEAWPNLL